MYKKTFLRGSHLQLCLLITVCFVVICSSCSKKNYSTGAEYLFKSADKKPNYADLHYWAAHPWKKDPSDSVPKPIRNFIVEDSTVDVFFIHPTTLTANKDKRWNADIDDATLNAKTDYSTILYQASAFNKQCRVFAPRYRQVHIRAYYVPLKSVITYFDTAYEDVKNAFEYYLKNYNNGHPIIIASHSQGTTHAAHLLKDFFENKPLQNKLVCAYILGMPIAENYFSTISMCKDSSATGCFVSWRTYHRGYVEPLFVAKEEFKAAIINPLTWTMDTALVSSNKNMGGVMLKFNKIIPNVVNSNIHHNVLWTSKPNVFGKFLYTQKNYHVGDINLFYMNIRQNVKTRIDAFWKL
ncbi:MAG: DUF3089 domain-containing protein [Ferruginibacter sp.]|nr:DUF3089 domain-containing protein [Ferruginibacter sp.]